MLALERPVVVVAPHLIRDLERFFESFEALLQGRERDTEPEMLAFEPGGADAQPGASAGEHVERGDLLEQDSRVAVRDARDHRPQAEPRGLARSEERRVGKECRSQWWTDKGRERAM